VVKIRKEKIKLAAFEVAASMLRGEATELSGFGELAKVFVDHA